MEYIRLFLLCVSLTACTFLREQGITPSPVPQKKTEDAAPTITSLPTNTATSTHTPPPTTTPVPTRTPSPDPTLTPEPTPDLNIEAIEQILSEEIGPDWNSFIEWREQHKHFFITMVSEGKYLDYTDNPLNIPISDNPDENPEMLVGTNAYYLDLQGQGQEVILPLVIRLTDERLYRLGPYRENIVDWPTEEIISNLPTAEGAMRGAIGGLKGEILKVFYLPSENIAAYYQSWGVSPLGDPFNILDELNIVYQETHKEELEKFITSGKPPSSGILLPSTQNGMLGDDGSVPLP